MNKQAGFTLIEAVITIAIMGIASVGFMRLNDNIIKTEARMMSMMEFNNASTLIRQHLSNPDNCQQIVNGALSSNIPNSINSSSSNRRSNGSLGTGNVNSNINISNNDIITSVTPNNEISITLSELKDGKGFYEIPSTNNLTRPFLSTFNANSILKTNFLKVTSLQLRVNNADRNLTGSDILQSQLINGSPAPKGAPIKVDFLYTFERDGKFRFRKTGIQTLLLMVNEEDNGQVSGQIKDARCITSDVDTFNNIMPQVCEALNQNLEFNSSTNKCEAIAAAAPAASPTNSCPCDNLTGARRQACLTLPQHQLACNGNPVQVSPNGPNQLEREDRPEILIDQNRVENSGVGVGP